MFGLVYFAQDVARRLRLDDPDPWREAGYWTGRAYLFALLTPVILWLGRRWPIEQHNWPQRTALHLILSVSVALSEVILETTVLAWVGVLPVQSVSEAFARSFPILMTFGFHTGTIAYWVVLSIQSGARYHRQFREREQEALRLELHASALKAQLAQAQLSSLKMQLHPHFFFNTLNAIVVLVRQEKVRQAEETLERFSDLLRAVLSDMDVQRVPLSRELEYLRLYLSIEELRFSDRLRVEICADPAVLDAAVPHMALQPIVENAIRHGIGRRAAAGRVEIRAAKSNEVLQITVADDGPGFVLDRAPSSRGIGLANTRARLEQLYGEAAELLIGRSRLGGALVTLRLPYEVDQTLICDVRLSGVYGEWARSDATAD